MITSSYGVDSIEDAFEFALKMDLTFKGRVSIKAWEQCSKCKRYGHYDYQCPLKSRHVNIVPNDDVDNSKIVEDVHVHSEISSIIEDTSFDPSTDS